MPAQSGAFASVTCNWQALMLVQLNALDECHDYSLEWSGNDLKFRLDVTEVYHRSDQEDNFPESMSVILNLLLKPFTPSKEMSPPCFLWHVNICSVRQSGYDLSFTILLLQKKMNSRNHRIRKSTFLI